MTGFEPQISGVRSDHSTNCSTTNAQVACKDLPIFEHFQSMDPTTEVPLKKSARVKFCSILNSQHCSHERLHRGLHVHL